MTTPIPLLRRPSRPSPEAMQRAVIRVYQLGGITPNCATQQLMNHGMDAASAARAVANAIEVKV